MKSNSEKSIEELLEHMREIGASSRRVRSWKENIARKAAKLSILAVLVFATLSGFFSLGASTLYEKWRQFPNSYYVDIRSYEREIEEVREKISALSRISKKINSTAIDNELMHFEGQLAIKLTFVVLLLSQCNVDKEVILRWNDDFKNLSDAERSIINKKMTQYCTVERQKIFNRANFKMNW